MLSFRQVIDDISVRFLNSEPTSCANRVLFQMQQAHWYYMDHILPTNRHLPKLDWEEFAYTMSNIYFPQTIGKNLNFYLRDFNDYLLSIPVCGVILIDCNNNVLLVKGRNWSFPKGKIDQNESEEDCAVRECYEETGYKVKVDPNFVIKMSKPKSATFFVIRNFDRNTPRDKVVLSDEIREIKWVPIKKLNTYRLFGGTTVYNILSPNLCGNKNEATFGTSSNGWSAEDMFKINFEKFNIKARSPFEYQREMFFA